MDSQLSEDAFEWEVRDPSTSFGQHAVAGSCAGVMEHIGMYPVDTVKTQMQASPERLGVLQAVRSVVRNEGMLGFMRGSTVIGAGCIPAHIGFFTAYEVSLERLVGSSNQDRHPARVALCGALATVVHDVVLTPHDVVKQRLQLGCHRGALDCMHSMWAHEGVRGFYRSLPVTLAMNIPYTGMLVAVNDALKAALHLGRGSSGASLTNAPWYFCCAGVSGAAAAALTSPLDVIKTRLQTQGLRPAVAAGAPMGRSALPYLGMLSTIRSIAQEEGGVRGFFRGVGPRVVLAAPSAAISWGTYETIRMALCDLKSERDARQQQHQRWSMNMGLQRTELTL